MLALLLMAQAVPATQAGVNSPIAVPVQGATNGKPVTVDASGSTVTVTGVSTSANQTNVQSAPGTSASTALTVQGSATGVPVPVSGQYASTEPTIVSGSSGYFKLGVRGDLMVGAAVAATPSTNQTIIALMRSLQSGATGAPGPLGVANYVTDGTNLFTGRGDATGPWVGGHSTITTGQVTCTTTATLIAAARPGRQKLMFNSTAATAFYYGAAGVTTTTGMYVPPVAGASTSLDTAAAEYCVTPTGTLTLSYVEEY